MRGTWQTTDSGGAGAAVAVIGVVVIAAILAGPVVAAVASLVKALVIAVVALAAVVGVIVAVALCIRRRAAISARPLPINHVQARQVPREAPRALPPARQLHLHFHGVTADEVAAFIRNHREQ